MTGNVNVYLIFPNLANGLQTVKIKTFSLIIYVDMVWQTTFTSLNSQCVLRYEFIMNLLRYAY